MVRFIVVESLILSGLLFISGYVFWETLASTLGVDNWPTRLVESERGWVGGTALLWLAVGGAVGIPVAGYLALQIAGATRLAFWALALVVLLLQAPAVLSYNRLDWLAFGEMPSLPTGLSQAAAGGLFLLSLVLLVTLHRTDDLRRLNGKLSTMNLRAGDQRQVVTGELVTLAGLVAGSLGVMAILGLVGMALGQMDQLLLRSPWTVLSVGGTAVFLMAVFLSLWLRTRRSS